MTAMLWKRWLRIMAIPAVLVVLGGILDLIGFYCVAWIFLLTNFFGWPIFLAVAAIREKKTKMTGWQKCATAGTGITLAFFAFCFLLIASVEIGQASLPVSAKSSPIYLDDDLADVRGQIHVHSYLSDDSNGTFEEIAAAARANGVSFIILTDHISSLPAGEYPDLIDGVLFIYGSEQTWKDGSSYSSASLKEAERKLNLYGHIEYFRDSGNSEWDSWDAIELVNFHANSFQRPLTFLGAAFFNPKSIYRELCVILPKNLEYWQKLAEREGRPIPIFAATDAHQSIGILGTKIDPYKLLFSLASTHVQVNRGEELNQESIFSAIKKGRTYIVFDYLGDPSGFRFWASDENSKKFFTGDSVRNVKSLTVRLPNVDCRLRVFCNNRLISEGPAESLVYTRYYPEPGLWRVEIERDGYLWIISGQILVK